MAIFHTNADKSPETLQTERIPPFPTKKRAVEFLLLFVAEREGFEPPDPRRSTVFKTAAFDHSAIFPGAKVQPFFGFAKFFFKS